jgi:tellurite resistance protein
VPEPIRKAMFQVAAAMAWADGAIKPDEASLLASACRVSGLSTDSADAVQMAIASGVTLEHIDFGILPLKYRETVLDLAAAVAVADGAAGPAERALWRDLARRLAGTGRARIRLPRRMTAWMTN